mgnify:CR=1 FL=1
MDDDFGKNKEITLYEIFSKLYYLHCYSNNNELPIIDFDFVKNIMKIICSIEKEDKRGRKPKQSTIELKNKLKIFYDTHYKKLLVGENNLYFTHLNTLLDYETEKILTCFENHISLHFYDFFNRYINVIVDKKKNEDIIKNKLIPDDEVGKENQNTSMQDDSDKIDKKKINI